MNTEQIISIVSEGKGAMISYRSVMPLNEIKQVAEYVQTLKK
jgi:hypothetical protein